MNRYASNISRPLIFCVTVWRKKMLIYKTNGIFFIPVHQFFPICFAQCFDCIIPVFNSLLRMFVSSAFHPCPLLNYALCQWQFDRNPLTSATAKKCFLFWRTLAVIRSSECFLFNWIIEKKFYFLMGYYCQNNYCNFLRRHMACILKFPST